jgi:16S rRNA (cytidine1402-2'-O)-methyltransferase
MYCHFKNAVVVMDTPYRLERLLQEINEVCPKREIFLGLDLNLAQEECLRGNASMLLSVIKEFKREFILILSPQS